MSVIMTILFTCTNEVIVQYKSPTLLCRPHHTNGQTEMNQKLLNPFFVLGSHS